VTGLQTVQAPDHARGGDAGSGRHSNGSAEFMERIDEARGEPRLVSVDAGKRGGGRGDEGGADAERGHAHAHGQADRAQLEGGHRGTHGGEDQRQ
jgi:hypothetical protein